MNIRLIAASILFTMPLFFSANIQRLKLYAIFTPSHEILVNDWFLKTLQDDYDVVLTEHKQECASAEFMKSGWKKTTLHKVESWIQAVHDNWGSIFICSDVDIQFFQPTEPIIRKMLETNDLVIQKNHPNGSICSGFFACRANEKTLNLFNEMYHLMKKSHDKSDQNSMNYLIRSTNQFDITWDYLPDIFFAAGTLTGNYWQPGSKLSVPQNIILHHASHTTGIPSKIKQLEYVSTIVSKRNKK